MSDRSEPRRLGALLAFAILALPLLFVWLLLRSGYSRDLRIGAFSYAAAGPLTTLLVYCFDA